MPKERVERDEEDLVRLYLTDIGQYPLLTKDDEVRLAQAIEAGNAAREEMEDFRTSAARRMTIGIAADACRAGPIDAGPLVIGTWLSTAQTGRVVALAQSDLRRPAGEAAIAALPSCITPGAGPA